MVYYVAFIEQGVTMSKKSETADKTNPEWNDKMFKQASTFENSPLAHEFKQIVKKVGRPPKPDKKNSH